MTSAVMDNTDDSSNDTSMLLKVAEKIINHALSMDTEISDQLETLQGQCILVQLTSPEMSIYCYPAKNRIKLADASQQQADCTIKGTLIELIKLTRADNPTAFLSSGAITIEGDNRLAQRFSDILSAQDIDFEEQLSQYSGDFFAHSLGSKFRAGKRWFEDSLQEFQRKSSASLREPGALLPTDEEISGFMSAVDQCRDDVDRLEAKLNRLIRSRDLL